ncbi:hypothetical protein [Streptomyces sp. NPDC060065]|uniref:hypothetical protein n=1 Tax=Streptomyces sp. NPDC060065 TaxID=3347050 RepID=UPI0036982C8E
MGPDAEPELRAEIAVDRWFFRIEVATKSGDGYFESYIIRHLVPHKEPAFVTALRTVVVVACIEV